MCCYVWFGVVFIIVFRCWCLVVFVVVCGCGYCVVVGLWFCVWVVFCLVWVWVIGWCGFYGVLCNCFVMGRLYRWDGCGCIWWCLDLFVFVCSWLCDCWECVVCVFLLVFRVFFLWWVDWESC